MWGQSSQPATALFCTSSCSLLWKSFALLASTSRGSKLYTATSPSADRLTSSRNLPLRGSLSSKWCLLAFLLVFLLPVCPLGKKKFQNCGGPSLKAARCTNPSIAMSRRVAKGASRNSIKAETSSMPSCRKKFRCRLLRGASTVSVAW